MYLITLQNIHMFCADYNNITESIVDSHQTTSEWRHASESQPKMSQASFWAAFDSKRSSDVKVSAFPPALNRSLCAVALIS